MNERVGPNLILVGTAHISKESVEEVERVIAQENPDVVAVELDAPRLEALENPDRWQNTPVQKLLKGDKLWMFLTQMLLASYQRRLGEEMGVPPGSEMLAAIKAARLGNYELLLADREIGTTMKRAYARMRFFEKLRLSWELMKSMVAGEEEEEVDLKKLLEEDTITQMMTELGRIAPSIKSVIIDERDVFLATKIRAPAEAGKKVVAVVGAGHVAGIKKRLQETAPDLAPLETIPKKKFPLAKILGWTMPLFIVGLFVYFGYEGYREGNFEKLRDAALFWILITGGFAAVGAIFARGHPLSVLTAFVAAPVTTLHPALAAGWFAGIVEAWVRTPVVADFQNLSQIKQMKDFFGNRVIRVLMVAALANVGAMAGFFVAGYDIVKRFAGG
ncbi:MAG: TraB/GumN family protein [Euryarchaeota archaeon]|nr:TraB/GumN family protein [Euryarchaeota archaeon]